MVAVVVDVDIVAVVNFDMAVVVELEFDILDLGLSEPVVLDIVVEHDFVADTVAVVDDTVAVVEYAVAEGVDNASVVVVDNLLDVVVQFDMQH